MSLGCAPRGGWVVESAADPCPGLLRTAELFPPASTPLLVVSSAFSFCPPSLGLPHFYLLLFFCIVL